MKENKVKFVNFRANEALHKRIVAIAQAMSERLKLRVSNAYVARLALEQGLDELESE